MNTIASLVTEVLQSEQTGINLSKVIHLTTIAQQSLKEIQAQSGLDLRRYLIAIDSFSIKHTLKGHGNKVKENLRGQEGVTPKDFEYIPYIINHAETIVFEDKNKQGNYSFRFEATLHNHYVVIMEVRTKRKILALKTMRIFKAKKENQNLDFDSL